MTCWLALLMLAVLAGGGQAVHVYDVPYEQAVSTRMTYEGKAAVGDWPVLAGLRDCYQLVASAARPGGVYVASTSGLFYLSADDALSPLAVPLPGLSGDVRLTSAPGYDLVVVSADYGVAYCRNTAAGAFTCPLTAPGRLLAAPLRLTAVAVLQQRLWLGTTHGLYWLDAANVSAPPSLVDEVGAVLVTSLAALDHGDGLVGGLAVGTAAKLWRLLDGGRLWHFWYTDSSIDSNITALSYSPDGHLWIGNVEAVNVMRPSLQLERYAGGVLPYGNVTSMPPVAQHGAVWLGSSWGLMRFVPTPADRQRSPVATDNGGDSWRYFNGPRWLPGNSARSRVLSVCSVALPAGDTVVDEVVVATDYGLARISIQLWSLARKADQLQSLIYPRHDRYGQTADCQLQYFGNVSSWQPVPSDNDGLWTNIYLASQALRYAVTGSPDAALNARHAYKAMHFLQQVTGLPGYPARSFARYGDAGTQYQPDAGQHTWFNSTSYPGWVYKSDTSSDEICGHQFGLPIYHQLVQPDDAASLQLFVNITDWILANDYRLVSPQGLPTTWGFWSPALLNHNPDDYDERGLNSLQILGWLQTAHRHTGDARYLRHYDDLVARHGYGVNIVNQKVTVPNDDNYSDDELAWLPFATWLFADPAPSSRDFWLSINRTIDINARERSSLWNAIYLLATGTPGDAASQRLLHDAVWCLQTWPLEQIDWPVQNSQRFDIEWRWFANRDSQPDAVNRLRYDELSVYRWNADPYQIDGGSGYSEADPSAWLLPYWLLRFAGFLQQQPDQFNL